MRAAIRLLTLLCLLWCGLHVAEPATAHPLSLATASTPATASTADPCDQRSDHAAPSDHHHCPIAPDQRSASAPALPRGAATAVAAGVPALSSLTREPPLQPPAA